MNEREVILAIITSNHVECHISMIPYGSTYGLKGISVRNHLACGAAPPIQQSWVFGVRHVIERVRPVIYTTFPEQCSLD